jgi:hypothetical protein
MSRYVTQAFQLVSDASLRHPDRPLLECCLRDAKDADRAAEYFVKRCEKIRTD